MLSAALMPAVWSIVILHVHDLHAAVFRTERIIFVLEPGLAITDGHEGRRRQLEVIHEVALHYVDSFFREVLVVRDAALAVGVPRENDRCALEVLTRKRLAERIDDCRRRTADLGRPVIEVDLDIDARLGGGGGRDLLALAGRQRMGRTVPYGIEELLFHRAAGIRRRQRETAGPYRGQGLDDLLFRGR